MKVRSIMTSPAVTVAPNSDVRTIAAVLVKNDIGGVPVVDGSGRVLGMVTESDLIVRNANLHFPRFLQIMLRNLVANALEFSPKGGVVTINLFADNSLLRIAIRDDGPGIDSVNHDTVFDRFRQLDRGPCKSHRGLGLGLSICRALAELSGGTVCIESSPGAGSEFILTLPRQTGEAASSALEGNLSFLGSVEQY